MRPQLAIWVGPVIVALVATALQAGGEPAIAALQFDRADIASGELWRLLSGHFVHLNTMHLVLNAAGLGLVWVLVRDGYGIAVWGAISLLTIVFINAGFWFLMPELQWYVGLSGLLHGLLAAGALGIRRERPLEAVAIGVILAAKLGFEAFVGPLPGSESAAGAAVITEAHLFGAIGGLLAAGLFFNRVRSTASI